MIFFESPNYLLFLPLIAAVCAIAWSAQKKIYRSFKTTLISSILRIFTLAFLALSLAQPYRQTSQPANEISVLADISASISDEDFDKSMSRVRELTNGLPVKLRVFGSNSSSPSDVLVPTLSKATSEFPEVDRGTTNLSQALMAAASSPVKIAILLSDGNETDGDALESARVLAAQEISIFPVFETETGTSNKGRLQVSYLEAPLIAAAQKSVSIQTSIKNTSSVVQKGTLTISHGAKKVLTQEVSIPPNHEEAFTAESDPSLEGLNEISAAIDWSDKSGTHHDGRTIFLSGEPREKVLLVNGSSDDDRILSSLLKSQSYQLSNLTAGDKTLTLPSLTQYAAIIFNNISHQQLAAGSAANIKDYVSSGGSFIMNGGDRSFGLGGYIRTPIEDVLPVTMLPPQTEKKRLNLAVQLVIDKSRSMASDNKLDFAREAAVQVVKSLKDDDYVGVIGFDNAPFIALPIAQLSQNRSAAEDRISRLFATGRTNLFPAIDEARRGLARVNAGRKHMIILTDGKIPDAGPYYLELVRQIRGLGITVSSVLLGDELDDTMLKQMAELGGGSFYQTANAQNLPRIFLNDVKVSSGEETLKEKTDISVKRGPAPPITHIDSFPPLLGYVETKPKEKASLDLLAMQNAEAEPLLAWWKYGQGKSFAFTSDTNGRWTARWANWERFSQFWADILDAARDKTNAQKGAVKFDLKHSVQQRNLILNLSIYSEDVNGSAKANIIPPSGTQRNISFTQKGPGQYEAILDRATAGKYILNMTVGNRPLPQVGIHLPPELFGEQKDMPPNWALLSKLANITGGRLNPENFASQDLTSPKMVRHDLDFLFLSLAIVTFLLEIAGRELFKALSLRGRRPKQTRTGAN